MKYLLSILFIIETLSQISANKKPSEKYIFVNGYVCDSLNQHPINGANILLPNKTWTVLSGNTNRIGYFRVKIIQGKVQIKIAALGYEDKNITFRYLNKDTLINVSMQSKDNKLGEVVIMSSKPLEKIESTDMGHVRLSSRQIKNIPTIFGESDVIKALQTQPGVSGGTEGLAGMYVRGGENDENLMMIDGTPLYQINHLGGLFSPFNVEAVKSVDFYKSAFPVEYGGRLSSVLDIHTKDGNMKEYHGSGTLGLTSGNINAEGPIWKNHTSFNISLRRSWLDLLTAPAIAVMNAMQKDDGSATTGGYAFTDLNFKVNHILNPHNKLYLTLYYSADNLHMGEKHFPPPHSSDTQ